MKILVGWSDSPGASAAVAWAKDLVARHGGAVLPDDLQDAPA